MLTLKARIVHHARSYFIPKKLRTRMLVSLLLLSSIPVFSLGMISSSIYMSMIKEQTNEYNTILLKQTEIHMYNQIKKINDLLLQYSLQGPTVPGVMDQFLEKDLASTNSRMVWELTQVLIQLRSGMDYVSDIHFYSGPYNKLMNSTGEIWEEHAFFDQEALAMAKEYNYVSRWLKTRMIPESRRLYNRPVMTLIVSIGSKPTTGALILYLDAGMLSEQLILPKQAGPSRVFVLDGSGHVILSDEYQQIGNQVSESLILKHLQPTFNNKPIQYNMEFNGKPSVVSIKPSDTREWYYVTAIAEADLYREPIRTRNTMLWISALLVLTAALVSLLTSSKLYSPLQRLTRQLSGGGAAAAPGLAGSSDEIQQLEQYVRTIQKQNEKLAQDVEVYTDHYKNYMLQQLLLGNALNLDVEEYESMPREQEIGIYLIELNMLQMTAYSRKDQFLLYYCVENMTQEILSADGSARIVMLSPGLFAALLFSPKTGVQSFLQQKADQLLQSIQEYLHLTCNIAISCSTDGIDGLHEAYLEASHALRFRFILGDNHVLTVNDIRPELSIQVENLYEFESRLIDAIQASDLEEAERLFESMHKSLKEVKNVQVDMLTGFFAQLVGSVIKTIRLRREHALDSGKIRDLLLQSSQLRNLAEFRTFIREQLFPLMAQQQGQSSKHEIQVQTVLDYIQAHYDDDLSLQQCADLIGINPFHLSRIFKQVTGQNFVDYVIQYRINISKELLCDPANRLQDISEKLRYTSVPSFIRAFKKVTGMTPGQYRQERIDK